MIARDPVMQAMADEYMASRSAGDKLRMGEQSSPALRSLRERIVMALITSPQPIADMIMAAQAVEAYITGPECAMKVEEKAASQHGTVHLQEGITALVEARFPHVKVVKMISKEPSPKCNVAPFGTEGEIIIKLEVK